MNARAPALLLWAVLALGACNKVPIVSINAGFALADATWFEEEQTLFFFYNVGAEQGLGPDSQIEVTWRTDLAELPWTPISNVTPIHTHLPVACGPNTRCGSISMKVQTVPREVGLRLRYHKDGALTLTAPLTYNIIGAGPAHTQRSLIVYGVFEETNHTVQWRARHPFPTLRNDQVRDFGLRRKFHISSPEYGDVVAPLDNPYGYGFAPTCPAGLTPLPWGPLETSYRAIFDPHRLPLEASTALGVCAQAIVTDAKGTFASVALARKNPEVHPAFPSLRSPIRENTEVGLLLRICNREISKVHQNMQVQRLILEGSPEICIDDYKNPSFPNTLAGQLKARLDLVRARGKDMVLALALHHDDTRGEVGAAIEKALEQILPLERDKSSPRVSGAFVFDTFKYNIVSPQMRALVLWCPARMDIEDLDKVPDNSQITCAIRPDFPDLNLGPFKFGNLPILPTRPQYLTFIAKYSEAQAGKVIELSFRAPERTPLSQNVQVGEFGVVTFYNNETFSAQPTDAFSFCASGDERSQAVFFRVPFLPQPLPLSSLPQIHELAPSTPYEMGLFWDFPFLTRMNYEFVVAGAVSAFSLSVPFGISTPGQNYYGAQLWMPPRLPDGGV
ncbi:MAG: hypothetical protein H6Q89_1045, partial [Myxococcaceae bacterium]|nr:hypothetical protein [Myxococcaceae bacterium]